MSALKVDVVAPMWLANITVNSAQFPQVASSGEALIDSLEIKNYSTTPASFDSVSTDGIIFTDNGDNTWSFPYEFDANHVQDNGDDTYSVEVNVEYNHYDTNVKASGKAFFSTSRNQNYSNGIYNVVFVSGVDSSEWSDYSSRVWWSKINNPLYFPDTNYIEVGSNDTSVQGLTKVGDYLGVVKQSKTTDTAIFLLYPTSFEEETTYAVKQGVQGVGALARYSFNILGDETLFLSPQGVMAIVPSQDEEHKVQNRSYFIDKQLLAESEIADRKSVV